MAAPDITNYLRSVPADDDTRAQAWEAYNNPSSQQDFEQRVSKLKLPDDVKAGMWEARYGSGKLPTLQAQAQAPTPQAQPKTGAPQQPTESFGHKAWEWMNAPVNVGHLRESLDEAVKYSNAGPTIAESNHPYLTAAKKAIEGFAGNAGKSLLTPLGVGLSAGGVLGEVPGAVGTAAKVLTEGTGAAFAAKGVHDVGQNPTPQKGESTGDYLSRLSGDAAMILGGGISAFHAGQQMGARMADRATTGAAQAAAGQPKTPEQQAQARVDQVVGVEPKTTPAATVFVDPALANEIGQWGLSDLPNKRIIARQTRSGKMRLQLAHSHPDTPGFQYTNTTADPTYTEQGQETPGQIQMNLYKTNGVRGTSAPRHFLAATFGEIGKGKAKPEPTPESASQPTQGMPQAGPEMAPEAAAGVAKLLPQPKLAETAPRAGESQETPSPEIGSQIPKTVGTSRPLTPAEQAKADMTARSDAALKALREASEKLKGVQPSAVQVEGAGTLGAHPAGPEGVGREEGSGGVGQGEQGPVTPQPQAEVTPAGGVQPGPTEAPAVEAKPVEAPPVRAIEPASPAALAKEDEIRPLVGQLMRLKQLRTGELASHAIDKAIDATRNGTEIDEATAGKIGKLLKEPVGRALTDDQIGKLESLRGGKAPEEPKIKYYSVERANELRYGPRGEEFEKAIEESQDHVMQRLADPNLPEDVKNRYMEAFQSGKYFILDKSLDYPTPTDLDEAHPEAPFSKKALGSKFSPINMKNLEAALGQKPRDLFMSTSKNPYRFITEDEAKELKRLEASTVAERPEGEEDEYGRQQGGRFQDQIEEIVGKIGEEGDTSGMKGRFFEVRGNPEYQEFKRLLQQKALDRRISYTEQALSSKAGEWAKLKGQASTPLTDQLSKLDPETQKLLPENLFGKPQPGEAPTSGAAETPKAEQPVKAARAAAKKSTAVKPGAATETEGIKHTRFDAELAKDPDSGARHLNYLKVMRKAIGGEVKDAGKRQEAYAKASKMYYDLTKSGDPFASKKVLDSILHTDEAGYVQLGKYGTGVYTPEQLRTINAGAADTFLKRWEQMSRPELIRRRQGLYGELNDRIEGALPTSNDPVIRAQQMDEYNELKERLDALKEVAGPTSNLYDSVMQWFKNMTEAAPERRMLREVRGQQARNDAILRNAFDLMDRMMESLPMPEKDRFYENLSRGYAQTQGIIKSMDPKLVDEWTRTHGSVPDMNDFADRIRYALDAARDRVTQASGNLQEFFVNYMPGMYDNQARARSFAESWASRRPLAGNSDFLKQKMYEFHEDAMKAGLHPSTANPVRAAMMRIEQLNRYTMAHEFKNRLINAGMADWYHADEAPPEGWEKLNDRIFGEGGLGGYWAPSRVARNFNNFVSSGLAGKWKVPGMQFSLYDFLRATNNLANQFQLGLSYFHGVETTLNSAFTATSVGLKQLATDGQAAKGLGNILKGQTLIGPIVEDAWNGAKGLAAWKDPVANLRYAQLASDLERANANVRVDRTFDNLSQVNAFKRNWEQVKDNFAPKTKRAAAATRAITNIFGTMIEGLSAPLMNYLIPRVKIGAFYRMAEQIHAENVGAHPDVLSQELQRAWDSVDNRFGQVNYDNMFLNKTARDIMQLTVRSPGWNIGTVREVGGGMVDAAKNVADAARGRGMKVSSRTAYTAALVMGTMEINAIYHYLHTGTMPQGMDYFFPKDGSKSATGEDNRVYPKDYVYDFINFAHDPQTTVWHKAAPDISTLSDIIRNEDYYHKEIRDPGNSPTKNAAQSLAYLAHQFVPFSISNASEATLRGQTSTLGSYGGILPAPRWVGRSPAENLANEYFNGTMPSGALDPVTLERKQDFLRLRNQVNQGKVTDEMLQKAIEAGKVNPKMVKYLYQTRTEPQLVTWTKRLESPSQVWNVWLKANPAEKQILLPTMFEKMARLTQGDDQEEKLKELEKYANEHK